MTTSAEARRYMYIRSNEGPILLAPWFPLSFFLSFCVSFFPSDAGPLLSRCDRMPRAVFLTRKAAVFGWGFAGASGEVWLEDTGDEKRGKENGLSV